MKVPALLALGLVVPVAEAGCKVTGPIKCYTDPLNARVLGNPVDDGGMTQEYCAQLCSDKKMPLAGVEFSTSIRVLLDFLLALYVSIHIANWWSLRERCVGKLWSPPPFLA